MGRTKRVRRTKAKARRREREPAPIRSDPGTSGDLPPALEGRPPLKRKISVQDPLGDWPETDAVTDEWLVDRGEPDATPDK